MAKIKNAQHTGLRNSKLNILEIYEINTKETHMCNKYVYKKATKVDKSTDAINLQLKFITDLLYGVIDIETYLTVMAEFLEIDLEDPDLLVGLDIALRGAVNIVEEEHLSTMPVLKEKIHHLKNMEYSSNNEYLHIFNKIDERELEIMELEVLKSTFDIRMKRYVTRAVDVYEMKNILENK